MKKYALQYLIGRYGKVWWTDRVTEDPIEAIEFAKTTHELYIDGSGYISSLFPNIQLANLEENDSLYSSYWERETNWRPESVRRIKVLPDNSIKGLKFKKL